MGTFLTRAPLVATGLWLAREVRAELDDPLTPVLAVGAAASAVVGSGVDAMLVTGAMAMNAVTGGVQRLRARQALDRLRDSERPRARVARSRSTMDAAVTSDTVLVDATDLAVGDVISVRVGDVVPADGRLISVTDLEIDESTLTGESLPRAKQVEPTPAAAVPDRSCMVFAGTTVVSGEGRAVVTATGDDTVSGRAAALAVRADPATGIQARLHELTRTALPWTAVGGALVTVMSLLRGNGMRASVAGGVAVAVAAVPEGLPLVATVAQLAAARRLARRGILVRAPRALEAMGRLDVVCFDKTGTLTENRLRVTRLAAAHGSPCPADDPSVAHVVRIAGRSCPPGADSVARQHATDDAVIRAAGDDPRWHPLDARPFTAERGYSAVLGENGDERVIAVKGAPEVVLPACADASDAPELAERLSREGLRVLAVARRACADAELPDDVLSGLEFVGFVGLADTPRDSAQPLVSGLRDAGVRPVMLTGDHPSTAHAIAVSLGWPQDCGVITGDELATMNRQARAAALVDVDVVARVAPEQKLQVIEALREAGKVVAMIGDGANDAAAIRAASVGIGVRARGSTAARNAADLVLTDDELTRLLDAVSEGKALWRSVADAVAILLGGNAGEVGFTVLGTMLGGRSPLSTRQLLLVNLLTDMFPAMAVAVTRPDDEPVDVEQSLAHDVRSRGITTGIGATVAWLAGVYTPGTARRTSTIALAGLVGSQLARTVVRRWHSPLVLGTVVGSAAVLAVIIQTPGVSHFFGCVPLGPVAWAGVAAGVGAATVAPLVLPLGESGPLPEARAA
jgi:cation-transporting ATPase I